MPSTTPQIPSGEGHATKSRQSSGGRSFFGRKLHKERPSDYRGPEDGNSVLDVPSASSSTTGSRSSRYSHKASSSSLDYPNDEDTTGLSMMAGVITTIPFESVPPDGKTPTPVDYLSKNEKPIARKDPLPHHLNKGGGDYHQYPSWDHQNPTSPNGSSHPTGPRPPPHASKPLSTLLSRETNRKPVQYQNSGDVPGPANGSLGTSNPNPLGDTSSNHRNSVDQLSVMSSVSSATRGSSIFSSDNSSRTAVHSNYSDYRPTSSRQSHHHAGWQPQQPQGYSSPGSSFNPEGFNLPRPSDDRVIEAQFIELMHKRGWHNLPEQARRQMMAYPPAKKWTLVHQDKLTEWQGEQKRRQTVRPQASLGPDGSPNIVARSEEEGSPEWYVRKVMDDTITAKQLGSLSVSLRTQPIRFVHFFPCYSAIDFITLVF